MFKNLNLEKKIKIKTRVNQIYSLIICCVAIFCFYKIQSHKEDLINQILLISSVTLANLGLNEVLKRWIHTTISHPIFNAVMHTSNASNEVVEATEKQKELITRHLQVLKNSSMLIDKLEVSSAQTKNCAKKVSEISLQALEMSSDEQEAVQANIEKMRTLKQKIEIIADLILELSQHTQQIGSIIGVVEDITEQTNMLALNAAVEAARAGEHGKGFAVVASEIRKLADESKQATTKITSLIHDIQQATNSTVMATEEGAKEIESGVDLAHHIAQSIDDLRNTISKAVQSIEEILTATNNQAACADEVSEAIDAINKGLLDSSENIKHNLNILKSLINVSRTLKTNIIGNTESSDSAEMYDYHYKMR